MGIRGVNRGGDTTFVRCHLPGKSRLTAAAIQLTHGTAHTQTALWKKAVVIDRVNLLKCSGC